MRNRGEVDERPDAEAVIILLQRPLAEHQIIGGMGRDRPRIAQRLVLQTVARDHRIGDAPVLQLLRAHLAARQQDFHAAVEAEPQQRHRQLRLEAREADPALAARDIGVLGQDQDVGGHREGKALPQYRALPGEDHHLVAPDRAFQRAVEQLADAAHPLRLAQPPALFEAERLDRHLPGILAGTEIGTGAGKDHDLYLVIVLRALERRRQHVVHVGRQDRVLAVRTIERDARDMAVDHLIEDAVGEILFRRLFLRLGNVVHYDCFPCWSLPGAAAPMKSSIRL